MGGNGVIYSTPIPTGSFYGTGVQNSGGELHNEKKRKLNDRATPTGVAAEYGGVVGDSKYARLNQALESHLHQ